MIILGNYLCNFPGACVALRGVRVGGEHDLPVVRQGVPGDGQRDVRPAQEEETLLGILQVRQIIVIPRVVE